MQCEALGRKPVQFFFLHKEWRTLKTLSRLIIWSLTIYTAIIIIPKSTAVKVIFRLYMFLCWRKFTLKSRENFVIEEVRHMSFCHFSERSSNGILIKQYKVPMHEWNVHNKMHLENRKSEFPFCAHLNRKTRIALRRAHDSFINF